MSPKSVTNVAASVHQRPLNRAHEAKRPFNELLQYYSMERFLYRLSKSPHADKFILKGALMLVAWKAPITRPTMDIDLLGKLQNDTEAIARVMGDVCREKVPDDGVAFDPSSITTRRIDEDADYQGVRVKIRGRLGNARLAI
ncbi:MAG TPA: nucleotidyl transferase AbiEii/AbiGii toxin family protein, partial [Planctomycetota bacterium]|nr:nucleotidyl transferase AbiEii/AbiGii toxin family protein [Planctomycetota bacterium]